MVYVHFFMSTDGMCNTQCGFSISLGVLSPHFFLHSSEPSSNSGFFFSHTRAPAALHGETWLSTVQEVCRRPDQGKLGYCASICTIINTNTHTKTSLMPAHVQFSSVTESNQLCHPRHKSPSTAVAPGPDGNRPRPVALVSVS